MNWAPFVWLPQTRQASVGGVGCGQYGTAAPELRLWPQPESGQYVNHRGKSSIQGNELYDNNKVYSRHV